MMKHYPLLILLLLVPGIAARAQSGSSPEADGKSSVRQSDPTPSTKGHPRPLMQREAWVDLDGQWDYAITASDSPQPEAWQGEITVPYAVEDKRSGVGKPISAQQLLWYRRPIQVPEFDEGKRVHLHFGAMQWEARAWINGNLIAEHRGGDSPISVDITELLGEEPRVELVVSTSNPVPEQTGGEARSTGMLQSVWLEVLPRTHLSKLLIMPKIDTGEVTVAGQIWGQANFRTFEVVAFDGAAQVASGKAFYDHEKGGFETTLKIPEPKLWSPETPHLYDLIIRLLNKEGTTHDSLRSYFALREISRLDDRAGHSRFALNGKSRFLLGALDQRRGTPGRDAEICEEISGIKAMGFNLTRRVGGLASPRYYHWADRLGLLVWQDIPDPSTPDPAAGGKAGRHPSNEMLHELRAIKDLYYSHPCIVFWPTELLSLKGPRRFPFVAEQLGHESGAAELVYIEAQSAAALPFPKASNKPALAVSGISIMKGRPEYESQVSDLQKLKRAGLSAAVFSELPDPSLGIEWLAETNAKLFADPQPTTARVLLKCGGTWSYTTEAPKEDWVSAEFDDSGWKKGTSPFGDRKLGAKTPWADDKLWARQSFTLDRTNTHDLFLKIANADPAKVYVNGKFAHQCTGGAAEFRLVPLASETAALLVEGANTIAIEIENEAPTHWLDAGLHDYSK